MIAAMQLTIDRNHQTLTETIDRKIETGLRELEQKYERKHSIYIDQKFDQKFAALQEYTGNMQGPARVSANAGAPARETRSVTTISKPPSTIDISLSELKFQRSVEKFQVTIPAIVNRKEIAVDIAKNATINGDHIKRTISFITNKVEFTKYVFDTQPQAKEFMDSIFRAYHNIISAANTTLTAIKFRPKIKIVNIPIDCTDDELLSELKANNETIPEGCTIVDRFSVPRSNRPSVVSAILAFPDMTGFNEIIIEGRLKCFKHLCPAYEDSPIKSCSKCLRYDHISSNCGYGVRCKNCGERHRTRDCRSNDVKCINCERYNNDKPNRKFNTSHRASHPSCPTLHSITELEKQRLMDFQ